MAGALSGLCAGQEGKAGLWGEDRLDGTALSQPMQKATSPCCLSQTPVLGWIWDEPSSAPALGGLADPWQQSCALPAKEEKQPVPTAPRGPSSVTGWVMPPLPHPEISHRRPEPRSNGVTSQEPPQSPGSKHFPLEKPPCSVLHKRTHTFVCSTRFQELFPFDGGSSGASAYFC